MRNGSFKTAVFAALGLFFLGAGTARAGVRRDVDELKHALGWDTLNLTTIDEDKAGRPTLERSGNLVNRVERRTEYFDNGKKSEQTVVVTSKRSKKTLYTEKSVWSEDGAPVRVTVEDDAFNDDGMQMDGRIDDRQYTNGQLTYEVSKEYSAATGQWGDIIRRTVTYYPDGDMKTRLTEYPASDEKTRETWGPKDGVLGRDKSTDTWNSSRGAWN